MTTLRSLLRNYGIYVALVIVLAVMSALSPRYLTQANLLNVLTQMSILSVLAVGMTLLLVTGNFDLSVGSTMGLTAAISLGLSLTTQTWIVVVASLAIGLTIGLVNGLIVVKAGINSLIVTLGMMSLVRGLTLIYTNGSSIQGEGTGFLAVVNGTTVIPNLTWVMIFIAVAMSVMLTRTRSGRYFTAIGSNADAARIAGIQVDRYKIAAFMTMGLLASTAGILLAARVNSVDPLAGSGFELQCIAAVVIGGTSLSGGQGSIGNSVVGAAILTSLNNGFNLLNVGSYYQGVLQGAVIILSVALYTRKVGS
ncbi:ABC transporter permease [Streptomyces sp. BE303]|uniref:ABC transporter permease n=1 Tax=Streptomyces sp. BE303 TaxID=3002528 RepID=UPI002E7897C8|nr:ABC transporter permease [Streptomyces sp. BE303]MED7950055.1 ABC transporter permease [Streptomyces sp. BE303]